VAARLPRSRRRRRMIPALLWLLRLLWLLLWLLLLRLRLLRLLLGTRQVRKPIASSRLLSGGWLRHRVVVARIRQVAGEVAQLARDVDRPDEV